MATPCTVVVVFVFGRNKEGNGGEGMGGGS